MQWMLMPAAGACQLVNLASSKTSAGPIAINEAVGRGPLARNKSDDVRVIQEALNQVTVKGVVGGPMPFLVVDGIKGPKTQAAIDRFQQVQVKVFDGVIEPAKKTILKLNEIVGPVSEQDLLVKLAPALPLAGQSLLAALANLRAVITEGPAASGPAAVATDRLNRHFKLDTLSESDQSTARVDLFRSYTRFSTTLLKPELFGISATDEFDLDKTNAKIALTRGKGFFEEGQTDPDTQKRLDRIHLGLGFFAPTVSPEFASFIIVHELSHFVGHADGRRIEDNGRGWFDDFFINPLSADERLTNADSYATFAHECKTGSTIKPAFVKTAPGGLKGAR